MGKDNLYKVSTELEIQDFLALNPGWTFEKDRLKAAFVLNDFQTAVSVTNKVFEMAVKMDHHPKITNTYNRLEFSLCTHSIGDRVTSYDIILAKEISRAVKESAD